MARINTASLIYDGWTKGAGGAWYYSPNGYSATTHLHLGLSGSDSPEIKFLSFKINDVGQGNISQYGSGNFSVSFADGIRDQQLAAAFVKAVNYLNTQMR